MLRIEFVANIDQFIQSKNDVIIANTPLSNKNIQKIEYNQLSILRHIFYSKFETFTIHILFWIQITLIICFPSFKLTETIQSIQEILSSQTYATGFFPQFPLLAFLPLHHFQTISTILHSFPQTQLSIFLFHPLCFYLFYFFLIIIFSMAHLSMYIGKAALQKFFPHLSNKQSATYNPQYNGWDSPEDMPKYNKMNIKNGAKADYLKQGQKLNAQLIQHIFMGEQFKNQNQKIKPNINQYQNANQKNRQSYPVVNNQVPQQTPQNTYNNKNTQNNQQFYNKPIPYNQTYAEQKPNKINQTQYAPPNNQYNMQPNQTTYPNNYRNTNQQLNQTTNQPSKQPVKPQPQPQHNQAIQNNQNVDLSNNNPKFEKKISAEEMDKILSS